MRKLQHNIAIFIDIFHVCDVITSEIRTGGRFRKCYQNGTMIVYDFFVPPKLTNLWATILLKYGLLIQTAIVRLRGLYFCPLLLKIGQFIILQNDHKRPVYEVTEECCDGISRFRDICN